MKKFDALGRSLTKEEQKQIMGGLENESDGCKNANTYCGSGSGVTCGAGCDCEDAGNAKNPNVPGGDKICA